MSGEESIDIEGDEGDDGTPKELTGELQWPAEKGDEEDAE